MADDHRLGAGEILTIILLVLISILMLPVVFLTRIFTRAPKYTLVFARYEKQLNIHKGREVWKESCKDVPPKAALLFCLSATYSEIDHEGFCLFFMDDIGAIAPEVRDGFKEIGMPKVADIIQRAMDKVGKPFPLDTEKRRQILEDDEDDLIDFEVEEDIFRELLGIKNIMFGTPRKFREKADAYAEGA